ncbi:uncharacterized protein [Melanerpes formicivorus]|uniref:uncharacterized protein n=1 Tax=Melanerpes formicivorus TaxID=211600 RepID=UPI00358FBD4B
MSCRDHHCKLPSATYVSTAEVMLSSSRQTPPPPFETAMQGRPFQKTPASAWHPPTGQSIAELAPGNGNSSPSNASSAAYRSRLDVVLAHADHRKGFGSAAHCVSLPDETSRCSSSPRHPLDHGYEGSGTQSASYRHYSERGKNVPLTSEKNGPLKLAVSLPSNVLSCKAPPSWMSRLDVDLSGIPVVSTLNSKNLHASLEPCDSLPPQQGCSQCNVQMTDLHASMKLYISTCSLTVKPFRADSPGSSHTHSGLLVPQLEKVPETPAGLPMESQKPKQGFPSDGSPALQITRFHVTSTKYPGLPQQTVSRDIWLSPAVLTGRENSPSGNEVMSKDLNPELIVFQNHHRPEFRKTPCDGLTPTHHKVSKITLILATPWTSMPIQVVREFQRSPSPTTLIKMHDSDIAGTSFHPVEIGAGLSLSVNPVCCSELFSSHWARTGLRPSQETCTLKSVCPNNLLANIPAPISSPTHRDMEDEWCPSIAVNIASFGSGRRVVKISIPF